MDRMERSNLSHMGDDLPHTDEAQRPAGRHFRVLTWNIHKGIGGIDRRYQLDRIIAVLRHLEADLCLLQEVDHGARRSRYHQQSEVLAEALGMKHCGVGLNHRLRTGIGAYGNVTLSRWPIRHCFNLDLTQRFKKSRGALYTLLEVPGLGPLHSFNFHLGLAHYERVAQVRRILEAPQLSGQDQAPPTLIGGDSNDWQGRLCRHLLEPRGFREASAALHGRRTPTFPAVRPVLPLDRLYFRRLQAWQVVDGDHDHIRHASDHRPLVVDFVLNGQSRN